MKEKETEGQRILAIAREKGFTPDELQSKSGINPHRLERILGGIVNTNAKECATLAGILSVDEVVIKNGLAARFWQFLREKKEELRFSRLWPALAQQSGLRGPDTLQGDHLRSQLVLFEQLLLEDRENQQEDTSETAKLSPNGKVGQMRLM